MLVGSPGIGNLPKRVLGAPGRGGDGQIFQFGLDAFGVATPPRQLAIKALIIIPKYRDFFRIKIVDLILGQR